MSSFDARFRLTGTSAWKRCLKRPVHQRVRDVVLSHVSDSKDRHEEWLKQDRKAEVFERFLARVGGEHVGQAAYGDAQRAAVDDQLMRDYASATAPVSARSKNVFRLRTLDKELQPALQKVFDAATRQFEMTLSYALLVAIRADKVVLQAGKDEGVIALSTEVETLLATCRGAPDAYV